MPVIVATPLPAALPGYLGTPTVFRAAGRILDTHAPYESAGVSVPAAFGSMTDRIGATPGDFGGMPGVWLDVVVGEMRSDSPQSMAQGLDEEGSDADGGRVRLWLPAATFALWARDAARMLDE